MRLWGIWTSDYKQWQCIFTFCPSEGKCTIWPVRWYLKILGVAKYCRTVVLFYKSVVVLNLKEFAQLYIHDHLRPIGYLLQLCAWQTQDKPLLIHIHLLDCPGQCTIDNYCSCIITYPYPGVPQLTFKLFRYRISSLRHAYGAKARQL